MKAFKIFLTVTLIALFSGNEAASQCLTLPTAFDQVLFGADRIIEGRVTGQGSFIGDDGNIYTRSSIDVFKVFKGPVSHNITVITAGGILGNTMQIVTPSSQMSVEEYGVILINDRSERGLGNLVSGFVQIDELSGVVSALRGTLDAWSLYERIDRTVGSGHTDLKKPGFDDLQQSSSSVRSMPEITSVFPLEVTGGTHTVLNINGHDFGQTQGNGYVSVCNADDGGQSFIELPANCPHYVSWSDTCIKILVPSTALYDMAVAGTGKVRVTSTDLVSAESAETITVNYAKSEIVFNDAIDRTMLVGMQNGGYTFSMNLDMQNLLAGSSVLEESFLRWDCNSRMNFNLSQETVDITDWQHDGINVIGMARHGTLPPYLLGKTITTFSGCGSPTGIQWNLIEIDVLFNADINWWTSSATPMPERFDLETAILHELGHAQLLQHNNNTGSIMYFQLDEGTSRRDLLAGSDIAGSTLVVTQAQQAENVCSAEHFLPFDDSNCDLSLINSIAEDNSPDVEVSPNPFGNELTLRNIGTEKYIYAIIDMAGRHVLSGHLSGHSLTLPTTGLANGMYVLSLENDSRLELRKLIKN